MLIEKIVLEGFLSYKKRQTIDLSSVTTSLVLGRINNNPDLSNGAGKSSLFEAIPVNFFGKGSGRADLLDRYINDDMSNMYIEIIFKIDNQRFRSIRSKSRDTAAVFEVFLDTTNKKLKEATWKKTDKSIEDILGLSAKTYSSTIYLNERESLQVITGTSSERKEILRDLLNIDVYEKASKFCNKQQDDFNNKTQVNVNMIQDKEQQLEQEPTIKDNLVAANTLLSSVKKELKRKEKEVFKLNEEKQEITVKIETEKILKEQIGKTSITIKDLEKDLQKTENDLENLNEEVEQQIELYKKLKIEIQNDIKKKPKIEQYIKAQEKRLKDLDKLDKEQREVQKAIRGKTEKRREIEKRHVETRTSLKPIREFLQKLENFDNVCPVTELACSVLKGDYKQSLQVEKTTELQTKETLLANLQEQLKNINAEIDELNDKIRVIEEQLETRQTANEDLSESKLELQNIIHQEEIFSNKETQYSEYIEETKKEKVDLIKQKEIFKEKIKQQKIDLKKLEDKVDNSLTEAMKVVLQNLSILTSHIATVRKDHDDIIQEIGEIKNQLEIFEKMKFDIKHLQKNNEENVKQQKIFQVLTTLFGKDGIQKSIMKESIPLLEQYTMEFLKIFNEDSEKIKIKFDLDPKKKDGELRKGGGLDILVLEEGKEPKDLQMYSGGETVRIVFSIVLSLAKLLSLRAGKRHEALIIDEKIAKLDTRGIELFSQVISEIAKIYKQVFVITHIETLKDLINGNEIIVNKTENGSEVSVI
jgi:exonuclease SbcC